VKYLCLVYAEEEKVAALSKREWDALVAENLELCEELRQSGHFVSAAPLDSVDTATTVRLRNGKLSTMDGPFAETKEQLGGYYLIEAGDRREALRVAGRIPGARLGSVEVRPLQAHDPREPWVRRKARARSRRSRPRIPR
jgi:hypothetical protein